MTTSLDLSLVPRSCPICAQSDESSLFAESNVALDRLDAFAFASRKIPEYMHWRLLTCRRCDLVYASPAPVPANLSTAYQSAAFDSAREARHAARSYARLLPQLKSRLPDLDGALDIGTGDGVFLEELIEAGFRNVMGVEPSTAPVEAASYRIRPLIKHSIFRANDFRPDSLSLVTSFQTLEHLSDPLEMASAAHRLLKPGGAAFFVGHNRRAVSARVLGRKSPIFDLEHLQLFSSASLRLLMETAGFVDVRVGILVNRYPLGYWVKLLPFSPRLKRFLLSGLTRARAQRIPVLFPAGNLWSIGIKPSPVA